VAQRHPLPPKFQVCIHSIQADAADQAMPCPRVHREPGPLQVRHATDTSMRQG
jgi:hypothetical protein